MPRKGKDRDQLITEHCCLLARQECCNYYKGLCLTDDGKCHLIGPYPTIHDGKIDCDWFLKAVLPQDKELSVYVWKEILRDETLFEDDDIVPVPEEILFRHCAICGKEFIPVVHNQKYCSFCQVEGKRRNGRKRIQRYRSRAKV